MAGTAAIEKAREYNRKMKQLYRKEEKMELQYLKEKAASLEETLANTKNALALPWEEVAVALRSDAMLTVSQNRALKAQVDETQEVINCLKVWMKHSMERPNSAFLWRNAILSSNPTARALEKEWITKNMYAATDSIFERVSFPPSNNTGELLGLDVECNDENGLQVVMARQYVIRRTVHESMKVHALHACIALMVDGPDDNYPQTATEVTESTTLHRMDTKFGEAVMLVTGSFHELHRSVLVVQAVSSDEKWMEGKFQRRRLVWFDMRPCPTGTLVRQIFLRSRAFFADGTMLSGVEEGLLWDLHNVSSEEIQTQVEEKIRSCVAGFGPQRWEAL